MRFPFIPLFRSAAPVDGLQEHAAKLKECTWIFQHAIECHILGNCESFEELREKVSALEKEADGIKRRIREKMPAAIMMPVEKFQLYSYLSEQDRVLDALDDALDWISYREPPGFPPGIEKQFFLLIDAVIDPVEEISPMVTQAAAFFKKRTQKLRKPVIETIRNIRRQAHEADKAEDLVKRQIFATDADPVTLIHMVHLAEMLGAVADHAENTSDLMLAMLAR
jgi:predicted phosphate transport protein (TIGR00153 family)